jgi:hypothetical protein
VADVPPERLLTRFPDRLGDPANDGPEERFYNLAAYDVVIAFDVDWTRLKREQLALLRKWVETRGGGLILVAGPVHTMQLGRPANAARLKDVLALYPVVPADVRLVEGDRDAARPWPLHFPDVKTDRAFLALEDGDKGPLAGWEEFFGNGKAVKDRKDAVERGFYSFYPVRGVKPGATVLATFGDPAARLRDGKGQPYLVTMAAGKGRVVYLGSGEMWRLRQFREAFHERFWTQLARHAAGGAGKKAEQPTKPAAPAKEGKAAKPAAPSAHDVYLEVQALLTLHYLKLTPEQMQALRKVARKTAGPARPRDKATVSDEYREVLTDLRNALVDANDDQRIEELEDKLDELDGREKPGLDDVEVTAAARKRVPEVLRQLKLAQLVAYLAYVDEEVIDPLDRLLDALGSVRGLKPAEWKEKRDEVAEEVAWLVAGVDAEGADRVTDQVVALLSKARDLGDAEFKARRADLEKEARKIRGDMPPGRVLQHVVERALAEMLSNPRLGAALEARLQ